MTQSFTILRDTREKPSHRLLFPDWIGGLSPPPSLRPASIQLTVKDTRLETGDYQLEGYPSSVIVERKGSLWECGDNCLSPDRPRFLSAISRLKSSCRSPYLLLTGTPSDLLRVRPRMTHEPAVALAALFRVLSLYSIPFLLLPSGTQDQRRALGSIVASLLIEGALTPGADPCPSVENPGLSSCTRVSSSSSSQSAAPPS